MVGRYLGRGGSLLGVLVDDVRKKSAQAKKNQVLAGVGFDSGYLAAQE